MKKLLLLLSFILALGVATMSAATASITFADAGFQNAEDVKEFSVGDVKFSSTGGPKYYTSGSAVRVYASNIYNVSCSGTITKITFTYAQGAYQASSFDVGSYADGVWTGSASAVTITNNTSAQVRITAIEVEYNGEGGGTTTPEETYTATFVVDGASYSGTTAATIANSSAGNVIGETFTAEGVCALSWTAPSGSSSMVSSSQLRFYQNNVLTVTPAAGVTVKKMSFKMTSKDYASKSMTCSAGSWTASGNINTPCTWEGLQSTPFTLKADAQVRLTYIEVEYSKVAGGVASPVISAADDNLVTITAEGADAIYYTTNGEVPTTGSNLYSKPFAITADCTVKAIAVVGDKTSPVTSFDVKYVGTHPDFHSLTSLGKDTKGIVAGPLTVVYQNDINLYLKDNSDNEDNFMLVYGTAPTGLTNGVTFDSLKATVSEYGKSPQYTPIEFGAQGEGTAVEPEELGLDELSSGMLHKYVKLTGVSLVDATSASGQLKNFTITDGDVEIAGRNNFKIDLVDGNGATVIGFVNVYNGTLQFYPVSVDVAVEKVQNPVFSPKSGSTLDLAEDITITCPTEGAEIHYTLNGDDPDANSPLYEEPIVWDGESVVKAIAIKDGFENSDIVTATYILRPEGELSATFDFTSLDTFNDMTDSPQDAIPAASNGISLVNMSFVSGPLKMTFTQNSGTGARWWNKNNVLEMRVYRGTTINLFTVQNDFAIKSISFEQNSGSTNFEGFDFTTNVADQNGSWANAQKTWTATSDDNVNMVSMAVKSSTSSATNNYIAKINVTYVASPGLTGIDGVEADNENAPVEYFNLQGIRVSADNLTPGIYIRRQGSKASKVLVK